MITDIKIIQNVTIKNFRSYIVHIAALEVTILGNWIAMHYFLKVQFM